MVREDHDAPLEWRAPSKDARPSIGIRFSRVSLSVGSLVSGYTLSRVAAAPSPDSGDDDARKSSGVQKPVGHQSGLRQESSSP